jgi:hypothetical protein
LTVAPARGWVYVLTNPAMSGLVKIGCTERTPEIRARELSGATGVPQAFVVAWAWPVADWKAVERITHNKLGKLRANGNREFFRCSVPQARRAVKRAARAYMRPVWLRLLVGPRRSSRASFPAWKPRRRAAPAVGLLPILLAALIVGLLAVAKPAVPHWLPSSVRASVAMVERL